jgi:hypothetical protein
MKKTAKILIKGPDADILIEDDADNPDQGMIGPGIEGLQDVDEGCSTVS